MACSWNKISSCRVLAHKKNCSILGNNGHFLYRERENLDFSATKKYLRSRKAPAACAQILEVGNRVILS